MRFWVYKANASGDQENTGIGLSTALKENTEQEALWGPILSHTHIDFLFKTFMHLLQLQLMLAAQLGLVPVFFFLEEPKLSELLAPEG